MPLFGFDEGFSMFDVTPVENLFLSEYLPAAKGDHVKVYLYGLMQAYHPGQEMTVAAMAHDLNLTEEEVMAAYRYWERRGLCIRVSDHPPAFRYRSLAQLLITQQKPPQDDAYEAFAEALHAIFGEKRKLHGGETTLAFEWVEEMRLPPEAVLLLIQHMIQTRGIQFSFAAAQKLAVKMAEEKVQDAEGAELFLARDKQVRENAKEVLRRLGKRRLPSEDELDLCQKWMIEWRFNLQDMLDACQETTKGEPTFAYLNGILKGLYERSGGKARAAAQMATDRAKTAPLKELLKALGNRRIPLNEETLREYEKMRQYAAHEVILLAARECAPKGGDMESVSNTLKYWKQKGVETPEQVQAFMLRVREQNDMIAPLFALWNWSGKPTTADRTLLTRWTQEWQFSMETIQAVAPYAQGKERSMAYLDALLKHCHAKGLKDAAAIQEELDKGFLNPQVAKTVSQQQYSQRPYDEDEKKYMDNFMKGYEA